MPKDGAGARAEQSAALATVIHNRNIDPNIAEWCAQTDETLLDDEQKANVREAMRTHQRAVKISCKTGGGTGEICSTWSGHLGECTRGRRCSCIPACIGEHSFLKKRGSKMSEN